MKKFSMIALVLVMVLTMSACRGSKKEDPLDITMVSLPYDQQQAVKDALDAEKRGLVNARAYIREVETGIYSR